MFVRSLHREQGQAFEKSFTTSDSPKRIKVARGGASLLTGYSNLIWVKALEQLSFILDDAEERRVRCQPHAIAMARFSRPGEIGKTPA
jgi:hypothetical protein